MLSVELVVKGKTTMARETKEISSINLNAVYDSHRPVIELLNEYASLRPAFDPTALTIDILLSELPKRIAEERDKVKEILVK